jgi:hypothetical protein
VEKKAPNNLENDKQGAQPFLILPLITPFMGAKPSAGYCRVSAVTTNQPAMVRATQPAILRKSAFFFQTTPQQAFFTARKRPLKTSVNVRLDTSGHARMLVDLLLVQPVKFV